MKNAIIYFYNIFVDDIKKINNNYYFSFGSDDFVITLYQQDIKDAIYMYELNKEMLDNGINTYRIVLTKDNNVLFEFNGYLFFLMIIPKIKNRTITYDDVLYFNYVTNNDKIINNLDKSNWSLFWSNKVDYIEYQFSGVKDKFPIVSKSINYFIGVWENAISYYNDNIDNVVVKQVAHKRIDVNMDLLSFYNPINLIIDTKERDIGEYLKSFVINRNYTKDNIVKMLGVLNYQTISIKRLICRILFPSYFFDEYDKVMVGIVAEDILNEVVEKRNNVLRLLNIIFDSFKNSNIPMIEWIKKED